MVTEVSFGGIDPEDAESGSGGGDRPEPGFYLAAFQDVREITEDDGVSFFKGELSVEAAPEGLGDNVGKNITLRLAFPHRASTPGQVKRMAILCKRLSLLPDDAFGDAPKSYPTSMVISSAKHKKCFIEIENREFKSTRGANAGQMMTIPMIAYAGVYDITDERMEQYWPLIEQAGKGKPPENGAPVDDI